MAFRIDTVEHTSPTREGWRIQIKGFEGMGRYCEFVTDPDGRGLYLSSYSYDTRPALQQLIDRDTLYIPLDATREQVFDLISDALMHVLKWGEERDMAGNIARRPGDPNPMRVGSNWLYR